MRDSCRSLQPLREKCAWVNQYEANLLQKEFDVGLVAESNLSKRENGGCQVPSAVGDNPSLVTGYGQRLIFTANRPR